MAIKITNDIHDLLKGLTEMKRLEIEKAKLTTKQRRIWRVVSDLADKIFGNKK